MRRALRPISTLIVFALFLAVGLVLSQGAQAPVEAAHATWHVNPNTGSNANSGVDEDNAVATIQHALDTLAHAGDQIIIDEGPITETISVDFTVIIAGPGLGGGTNGGSSLTVNTAVTLGLNLVQVTGGEGNLSVLTGGLSSFTISESSGTYTISRDPASALSVLVVTNDINNPEETLDANNPSTTVTLPTTVDDVYMVKRGEVLNVTAPGLLGNGDASTDPDAGTLEAFFQVTIPTTPEQGLVTAFGADGSFTYDNDDNIDGDPVDTFLYRAADPFRSDPPGRVDVLIKPGIDPVANPALAASCGIDSLIVIDSSGSVDATEPAPEKAALIAFVQQFLQATPSRFAIVEFNTWAAADMTLGLSSDVATITDRINATPPVTVGGAIANVGLTNYEKALNEARTAFPGADLIISSSDGVPTVAGLNLDTVDSSGGIPTPHPNAPTDADNSLWLNELEAGVGEANAAKTSGIPILVIGIGLAQTDQDFSGAAKPESTDGLGCAGCRARNGRFGGCGSGWWCWQGATVAVRACGQEETAVGRRSQACWRQAVERSARPSGVRSGAGSPAAGRGRR